MVSELTFSKEVRDKIHALQKQIQELEWKQTCLRDEIRELEAGQSPIKVGSIICWETGRTREGAVRMRRGQVLAVTTEWRGFVYRCAILALDGRRIGYAQVDPERCPVLDGYWDEPTKPPTKETPEAKPPVEKPRGRKGKKAKP